MSDIEPKIYMSDDQFAWLQSLERSRSRELLMRVEEQTQILKAQESRKDEALRDAFACEALVGIGTWMPFPSSQSLMDDEVLKFRAEWAYRQADAMVAARATVAKAGAA